MAIPTKDYFDKKFSVIDKKFEAVDKSHKALKTHIDAKLEDLNNRTANGFRDIQNGLISSNA